MEYETSQYGANRREKEVEHAGRDNDSNRDRGSGYNQDRNRPGGERRRNRTRPSRFHDIDESIPPQPLPSYAPPLRLQSFNDREQGVQVVSNTTRSGGESQFISGFESGPTSSLPETQQNRRSNEQEELYDSWRPTERLSDRDDRRQPRPADRYAEDRYNDERYSNERHGIHQRGSDRDAADRYARDRHTGNRHGDNRRGDNRRGDNRRGDNRRGDNRHDNEHDDDRNYDDRNHDDRNHDDRNHDDRNHDDCNYDDRNHDDRNHDDRNHDDRNHDDRNHDDRHDSRHDDDRHDDRARQSDRYGGEDEDRYGGDGGRNTDRGASGRKEVPSRTIVLKSLHVSVTDREIRALLQQFGAPIKDVRLVKDRITGLSRGFAFVEFQFLPDAQRWIEENQGKILLGGYCSQMLYSCNREREEDWYCSQCGTHNFKRREHCFKCSITKDDSERYSEISDVTSNVLILMGLDALVTEETITNVLSYLTSAKVNVIVARDNLTHTSRGFCYVELDTTDSATRLMNVLSYMEPPFQIGTNHVSVHYGRKTNPNSDTTPDAHSSHSKWQSQDAHKTLSPQPYPDAAMAAAAAHYQQASFDPSKLTETQLQSYQAYLKYRSGGGLAMKAGITAAGSGTARLADLEQRDKAAVAQEQVQAARRLKLQQQQLQQQLQKQVADDPCDETKLADQARQWAEEKTKQASDEEDQSTKDDDEDDDAPEVDLEKPQKKKKSNVKDTTVEAPVVRYFQEGMTYPTPDASTYTYDEASGFYYDSSTGLYYDVNSQYYYNSENHKYMYWDSASSTYLPAAEAQAQAATTAAAATTATTAVDGSTEKQKEKDKKVDKNKTAKKLAKDMARWAKVMNSSKGNSSKKSGSGQDSGEGVVGAADAGFAMLSKKTHPAEKESVFKHALSRLVGDADTAPSSEVGITALYGGSRAGKTEPASNLLSAARPPPPASNPPGDSGDSPAARAAPTSASTSTEELTDWAKLICQLCKRQFPSKEILVKHTHFSELHKQNLENLKQQQQNDESGTDYRYRDRAKERRLKFGVDDTPPAKKKFKAPKPTIPYEEPNKDGLTDANIGNKMLQKMGWNKGTGLGKKQQGRTAPIEVQKRQALAGLGVKGGTFEIAATDNYRDTVKKMMRSRFEEM